MDMVLLGVVTVLSVFEAIEKAEKKCGPGAVITKMVFGPIKMSWSEIIEAGGAIDIAQKFLNESGLQEGVDYVLLAAKIVPAGALSKSQMKKGEASAKYVVAVIATVPGGRCRPQA